MKPPDGGCIAYVTAKINSSSVALSVSAKRQEDAEAWAEEQGLETEYEFDEAFRDLLIGLPNGLALDALLDANDEHQWGIVTVDCSYGWQVAMCGRHGVSGEVMFQPQEREGGSHAQMAD